MLFYLAASKMAIPLFSQHLHPVQVLPGGRLAQLGSPAELLLHPADDFVADSVGRAVGDEEIVRFHRLGPARPIGSGGLQITLGLAAGLTHDDVAALATRVGERVPVSIYLVNGIKLQGQIESFDQFVILLKNTVSQMVYKHAISTVVPSRPVRMAPMDGDGELTQDDAE